MMIRLRLIFPAVTLIVGITMLSIPWIMPFTRPHERAIVFLVAGVVELVLGGTLAYVILHQPLDDADLPERGGRTKSSRALSVHAWRQLAMRSARGASRRPPGRWSKP